jgi:hypothetical protein
MMLAVFPVADADERMADVAVFLHAVWFSEEFNNHCPDTSIDVPVSESKLREVLALADGGNFVDIVARDPSFPDRDFREGMKNLARRAVAEGCDSESALMLREEVRKQLAIPDMVAELLQVTDATH